jgi:ABC transport system ATP-binding/permease protein
VVTSTLVFEGGGRVQEYVGGYEDWLRQRRQSAPAQAQRVAAGSAREVVTSHAKDPRAPRKLSYKEQRELEELPSRIDMLETEQRQLQSRVASAEFYKESAAEIHEALSRLEELETLLLAAYTRWDALDST